MIIVAIETCGEACSTALLIDSELRERHVDAPQRHTELVLADLETLRAEAAIKWSQVDAVAFGAGPGAFTGVRIAASVAHGLALACAVPLLPVSSLAGLAQGAWRMTGIAVQLALLDARRSEVYVGEYRIDRALGIVCAVRPDSLAPPAHITAPSAEWVAVGRGWDSYAALLPAKHAATTLATLAFPHAGDIATLAAFDLRAGRGQASHTALPRYLRPPV